MAKIGLLFVGAVRDCITDIKRNIQALQSCSCFDGHEIHTVFSAWLPEKEPQYICGGNYVSDYDMDELHKQLDGVVDTTIFYKQRRLDNYSKMRDGRPPITQYHLMELAKSLKKDQLKFDYVVKTRHDNFLRIKNIDRYLNNSFSVPPLYWCAGKANVPHMINDHCFISSFDTFMKYADLEESMVESIIIDSSNGEEVNARTFALMSYLNFIDASDIITYHNKNHPLSKWGTSP